LPDGISPTHRAFVDSGPKIVLIFSVTVQIKVLQEVVDTGFVTICSIIQLSIVLVRRAVHKP
jgi:hypothetical protein